jgi:hypothetical protein
MMEKYKTSGFPSHLSHTTVRPPRTTSSIRLFGPLDPKVSRFEANIGDGVFGIVTTTYPRSSVNTKDGLEFYENEHLGKAPRSSNMVIF